MLSLSACRWSFARAATLGFGTGSDTGPVTARGLRPASGTRGRAATTGSLLPRSGTASEAGAVPAGLPPSARFPLGKAWTYYTTVWRLPVHTSPVGGMNSASRGSSCSNGIQFPSARSQSVRPVHKVPKDLSGSADRRQLS